MTGAASWKVFVALHMVDHASSTMLHFGNLAQKAHQGVASVNKQLALMGSLAAVMAGSAGVGMMVNLAKESVTASMKISQLRLEMEGLGLTMRQMAGANAAVSAITAIHPAISKASGLHLFKDSYSVLGNYDETIAAMPFMAKFQLSMRGLYGERGDEMSYDAVRAAELQLGRNFSMKGLQQYLEIYNKVSYATGGRVDPQQIHGFLKNSPYGRMSQSPDAMAKQIMLMMEIGGNRAGTAFNALDRFAIAHIAQAASKERLEKWSDYGLIEHVQRNKKGKITDFSLKDQDLYQKDKVEWLYTTFAGQLKKHGIDAFSEKSIPAIAQLFSTQTAAGGAITTLLQVARNQKEVGLYSKAIGVDKGADNFEKSPMGHFGGLAGAWQTFLQTLGLRLAPTFVMLAQGATKVLQALTTWIDKNPEAAQGLFWLATAFFGVITVVGLVSAAIVNFGVEAVVIVGTILAGITGLFLHIAGIIVQGAGLPDAFRKLMALITMIVHQNIATTAGILKNIPGLEGLGAQQAYSDAMVKGGKKALGIPYTQGSGASGGGKKVSMGKVDIHIHGVKDGKDAATKVAQAMNDLIHPKSGYFQTTTPNGMHGFFA